MPCRACSPSRTVNRSRTSVCEHGTHRRLYPRCSWRSRNNRCLRCGAAVPHQNARHFKLCALRLSVGHRARAIRSGGRGPEIDHAALVSRETWKVPAAVTTFLLRAQASRALHCTAHTRLWRHAAALWRTVRTAQLRAVDRRWSYFSCHCRWEAQIVQRAA